MDAQTTYNEKYHYHRFINLSGDWHWCYSARTLQKELNQLAKGLVLKKMYISFNEYMDGKCYGRCHFNLAFEGGYVLLIFDKLAIEFCIHVEGQINYHFFSPEEINIEEIYGNAPYRYDSVYTNIVELQPFFDAVYTEKRVTEVKVLHTNNMWAFRFSSFDMERANKAAEANDLPERICFLLDNGVQVHLIGDDMEYCRIIVKKVPPFIV